MRRSSLLLALLLCLCLVPGLAQARAGSGASFGSRGSHTYSAPPATSTAPYGAAPMQQSTTVPGSSYGGSSYGGGYGGYGRSGLGAGLLGGLLGFGLGAGMFHHYGYGMGGLGLIIRLVIIFFVVRWIFRRFFGGNRGAAGGYAPGMAAGPMGYATPMASAQLAGPALTVTSSDYAAFEVLLRNVQAAWSNADINALRGFATPEMVSTFAEQLAGNASRGVRNIVADVRLLKGDLSEAWSENGVDYATVAMQYSMTDATYDQAGQLVSGSATSPVTATEFWTFLRAAGGHWVLSAIQQAR